jgi:hypothetical protein
MGMKDLMGEELPMAMGFVGNIFLGYAGIPARRSQSIGNSVTRNDTKCPVSNESLYEKSCFICI